MAIRLSSHHDLDSLSTTPQASDALSTTSGLPVSTTKTLSQAKRIYIHISLLEKEEEKGTVESSGTIRRKINHY